ncbi:hypothetical protein [uncultured Pseudokineococcus sp.]|uniref:hypothetical protein n=1 Tax=uncultured Pseudokineococcus sp. TaxID=1642928 RepID=UPI00262A28CA|nr:hypothetical protein [uncultured Pseudokineococcus sp.]
MRTSRLLLSAAAAAALALGVAGPASADHAAGVASLTTKHSACYVGANGSGIGVEVTGRLQNVQRQHGRVVGFKCLVKSFPKRVTPDQNDFGVDFTLTRKGYTKELICALDEEGYDYSAGILRVNGKGVGHIDCTPGAA